MELKRKPRRPATPSRQRELKVERFINIARELGCDEDEAAFDENLRKIATEKPGAPTKGS